MPPIFELDEPNEAPSTAEGPLLFYKPLALHDQGVVYLICPGLHGLDPRGALDGWAGWNDVDAPDLMERRLDAWQFFRGADRDHAVGIEARLEEKVTKGDADSKRPRRLIEFLLRALLRMVQSKGQLT